MKHKVPAAITKRYVLKSGNKVMFKAGYTSHRMSRRRPGTVTERSKRGLLTNVYTFKILNKIGFIGRGNK